MTNSSGANASILLLASDPLMRALLQEALEKEGYVVFPAEDVGVAVDHMKRVRPDLLIVRPQITSMPGHMAAHYLRKKCPSLRVMIVGGFMDDDRVYTQNDIVGFHLFPKPFTAAELLAEVKEVFRIG